MKTPLITSALAAALMFGATPAFGQAATGEIGVRGFVAARCGTTSGGGATTFTGTISLGELANAEGLLRASLQNSSSGSPAGTVAFQVGCTGTAATVTLEATRLTTTTPTPPGDGAFPIANEIDYTAQLALALTGGGITPLNYTTASSPPPPSTLSVNEAFAYVPENMEVRVFGFMPEAGETSILVAGNYTATISITITPA